MAAIPLLHATVGLAFWQLLVLVFLGGLLDAPGVTARASLLPDVASRRGWSLERASGASAVVERASRLAGAPLAGLLIAATSATSVLWIDAASFLVSAAIVAVRRATARGTPPSRRRTSRRATSASSGRGSRSCESDRTLFALVAVLTLTNMLDSVSMVALPVYAEQVYGSAVSLGLMMGVVGAGSVVGRPRVQRRSATG